MIIKNSNLRTVLSENRYKILGVIIAIILVLCVIRFLNEMAKQSNEEAVKNNQNTIKQSSTYKPEQTVIQGENVSSVQQEKNDNVMDNFIQYCNQKDVEKAYNLLTDECKEVIFDSKIQNFEQDYINEIFNTQKTYSMQSWIQASSGYTYKVKIMEDMLSTGKTGDYIEDYYTIVNKNGEYKLNINSYVGRRDINKSAEKDNISITVNTKDVYMDYEIYNIKVQNSSDKTIILDSKRNEKSAYITGSNGTTYSAFMYEVNDFYLNIKPRIYRNINIRFNKIYNANIKSETMSFTDIISDAENYNQLQNKKDYKNILEIIIDL